MPDGAAGTAFPVVRSIEVSAEAAFWLFADDPYVAWLESGGAIEARSRFSYLAVEPFEVLSDVDDLRRSNWKAGALGGLDATLGRFGERSVGAPVPFAGGAVGFLSYENGAALERVPAHVADGEVPVFLVGLYDVVLAFDRLLGTGWLISSGRPEMEPARRVARAMARADHVLERLCGELMRRPAEVALKWRADVSRLEHEARVRRAIAYIQAGDIYQANIAATFSARFTRPLACADLYAALRAGNAAPFSAFLGAGHGCAVASVSPERFLSVDAGGLVEARPIKGTRRRDEDPAADAALACELVHSAKDRAENLMIVDLLRNDLARVAEVGSVRVPQLAKLESFARVHHLVSVVQARLGVGSTAVDLLRAAFPAGSITGAPKIRAQEIIYELEGRARGPYCGSVFWLGWDGAMDSSVAIRTATVIAGEVVVQAGGGIVADSDPAAECDEVLVKVLPLLRALGEFDGW